MNIKKRITTIAALAIAGVIALWATGNMTTISDWVSQQFTTLYTTLSDITDDAISGYSRENIATNPPADSGQENLLYRSRVIHVIDGDTIIAQVAGIEERIRFIGIDTPERGEPGFDEATQFTIDAIANNGGYVYLQSDPNGPDRDRFGRLRKYIWLTPAENTNDINTQSQYLLNRILIDNGHAVLWGTGIMSD